MLDSRLICHNFSLALCADERGTPFHPCYGQYLTCLSNSLQSLSIDFNSKEEFTLLQINEHLRILNITSQCLDRMIGKLQNESITNSNNMEQKSSNNHRLSEISSLSDSTSSIDSNYDNNLTKSLPSIHPTINQSISTKPQLQQSSLPTSTSSSLRRTVTDVVDYGGPSLSVRPSLTGLKTPTEITNLKNRQLIENFQRRVNLQQQQKRFNPSQLSSMRLALQRKLAENLELARSKESTFSEQIVSALDDLNKQINDKMMKNAHLFQNIKTKHLLHSITMYDFHFLQHDAWYRRCFNNETNRSELCLSFILKIPDHPLHEVLTVIKQEFMDLLKNDQKMQNDEDYFQQHCASFIALIKEICEICQLQLPFDFRSIYVACSGFIMDNEFNKQLYQIMEMVYSVELNIIYNLCESDLTIQIQKAGVKDAYAFVNDPLAYNEPMGDLLRIVQYNTPLEKVSILTTSMNSLVQFVQNRVFKESGKKCFLSADDLLPIICFAIIRCSQPYAKLLWLQVKFLELFCDVIFLNGADGYSLTSFSAAMAFWSLNCDNE